MKNPSLQRKTHFLGTKIRNLRKRNQLTMDDLSARCVKIDPELAPSVSYLSMIERGKRTPSIEVLEVIAGVFQKEVNWFFDETSDSAAITPAKVNRGGLSGMTLEPSFLFSQDILQIAIPELLSQTGTTGRQFAHLVIRAYQERFQNHFPDLERAAENLGGKRMPLSTDDLLALAKQQGIKVRWFGRAPVRLAQEIGAGSTKLVRSFFDAPGTIYLNEILKQHPARIKYDLALYLGHCILHNREGVMSLLTGPAQADPTQREASRAASVSTVESEDILSAWRDFECSFFAGALLCPRTPFRQLLDRTGYEVDVCKQIGVTASVAMRRMTAVSPYPHWHYFDAYEPHTLKAVYRGNGIPLPWGNMRSVEDPCHHWAVFRMINEGLSGPSAQISVLDNGDGPHIYCCESRKVKDLAGNWHVLCNGIDLNPALDAQGLSGLGLAEELKRTCVRKGGTGPVPRTIYQELVKAAKILNIHWIERSLLNEARVICPRGASCPRQPRCFR